MDAGADPGQGHGAQGQDVVRQAVPEPAGREALHRHHLARFRGRVLRRDAAGGRCDAGFADVLRAGQDVLPRPGLLRQGQHRRRRRPRSRQQRGFDRIDAPDDHPWHPRIADHRDPAWRHDHLGSAPRPAAVHRAPGLRLGPHRLPLHRQSGDPAAEPGVHSGVRQGADDAVHHPGAGDLHPLRGRRVCPDPDDA